jgi:hypothetical protein
MVNAAVVQGRIVSLPGEICRSMLCNESGETGSARVRVKDGRSQPRSRTREVPGERTKGSVIGRYWCTLMNR